MEKNEKIEIFLLVFLLLVAVGFFLFFMMPKAKITLMEMSPISKNLMEQLNDGEVVKVYLNDLEINAEIAETTAKKTKGLSNITSLGENQGMLFLFSDSKKYTFWNKDTYIPLDLIWLNNGVVVDITYLPKFDKSKNNIVIVKPKKDANLVLEVKAGAVKKSNIKVGDVIKIKKVTEK